MGYSKNLGQKAYLGYSKNLGQKGANLGQKTIMCVFIMTIVFVYVLHQGWVRLFQKKSAINKNSKSILLTNQQKKYQQ